MTHIQHVNSKRKAGQRFSDKSFFSINENSTRRFISESKTIWETECGLLCDGETFDWISNNCDNNILVVTDDIIETLKTFHFYKEILISY